MSNKASTAKASFLSKTEYVIKHLHLKGKSGIEMHNELVDVYGSSSPSYAQEKFWARELKCGRKSLEDEARPGHPLDATDEEMCTEVYNMVYSDG